MSSTSAPDPLRQPLAWSVPTHSRPLVRWAAAVVAIVGLPLTAQAATAGARAERASTQTTSAFCSHIPTARVTAIVGRPAILTPLPTASASVCVYRLGSGAPAAFSEITIAREQVAVGQRTATAAEKALAARYARRLHAVCHYTRLTWPGWSAFAGTCTFGPIRISMAGALHGSTDCSVIAFGGLAASKLDALLRLATVA